MNMAQYKHTTGAGYKYQSNPLARFEPPADMRGGTIRGFLAMCSVFAALAIAAVMFA